jgi:hypothetical protein
MQNNSLIHFAHFATNPKWSNAVIANKEIPATAIKFYESVRSSIINNWWGKSAAANNL